MTILCTVCGYDKTPDASEFCDACGAELPVMNNTVINDLSPETTSIITKDYQDNFQDLAAEKSELSDIGTASLIAKDANAPIGKFSLENYNLIGIFDPDTGPVDLDLEDFTGNETVSRQHAEIYQETGVWKIKDLGSTNGVFIKPVKQKRFNARITSPTILNDGDEIAIAKIRFLFKIT
jgi:hypothetical protein